ncbi:MULTISPECIES: MurR/RpiR family transcriptional regulator [Niallia]|uniref:MurR/RpiR family transcriptional regulator n=1 Tax=Niallia TaxID=2837506 RepID=UPI000BA64A92|nr:MurR/RpiR family transcriptional regulator [Niallia circulans]MCM2981772.1 MurR/RpiR family transcriptional regulator [Niallia circulans]NRG31474.1 MurR/RpiR family transcriptional regulator [Niallia circulans]PAE10849.1 RpiR family transcriptional regulator [Niallia circulans]
MGQLIVRLLTILNNERLDSTNYHIAITLLNHYNEISHLSISEVAKLCNVSKSTISKFARSIGFDDYFDLKDAAPFIENRYQNDLNYVSNILSSIEKLGTESYFDAIIKDIEAYKREIDLEAIDRLAKDILHFKNVASFGLLFSESAAFDLQYKLAYNGKFIVTFQSDRKQEEYIEEAEEDTLIIIFSNSGNFLEKQQLRAGTPKKNVFKNTKAKIVVISSNPKVNDYDFVQDSILFPHQTDIQTHSFIYQIVMDMLVSRFRYYRRKES